MNIKKILPIFALTFALAGCGGDEAPANDDDMNNDTDVVMSEEDDQVETSDDSDDIDDTSVEEETQTEDEDLAIENAKDAVDTAKEEYTDYDLKSVSYEEENGDYLYKVELFKENEEVEVAIDPIDGQVVKKEEDTDDDGDDMALDEAYLDQVETYLADALDDANQDGSYYIDEWKLEIDDGRPVLEAEIYYEETNQEAYSYKIDPENGEILEKEKED